MRWLLIAILLMPCANALTLGVSPSHIDLGKVEEGKSYAVEFMIINPEKKAASFVIEETPFVKSTKSYRIKGKGSVRANVNVTAPKEQGIHDIPLVVLAKSNDALVPGITVAVRMHIPGQANTTTASLGTRTDAILSTANHSTSTHFIMPSRLDDFQTEVHPDSAIGLGITAGMVCIGLGGFLLARRMNAR